MEPLILFWAGVVGYPLAQVVALAASRGGWRSAAWLVLGVAGPVYLGGLWLVSGEGRGGMFGILWGAGALAFVMPVVVAALAIMVVAGHRRASPAKP